MKLPADVKRTGQNLAREVQPRPPGAGRVAWAVSLAVSFSLMGGIGYGAVRLVESQAPPPGKPEVALQIPWDCRTTSSPGVIIVYGTWEVNRLWQGRAASVKLCEQGPAGDPTDVVTVTLPDGEAVQFTAADWQRQ